MNALMAKLTNLAEGMEETQADLQEKTYVVEGIAKGIKQAMAVIQQHLDHAEEIQAQDDEAAREQDDPDAERRRTPEYRHGELSFEQLAEDAQEQVRELLRRRQEQFDYASDRVLQNKLLDAANALSLASRIA